ncbi:MAG: BtpA/SgcQ family protein [Planctomycetota bacterium]|nr:MAG: BtpA/SgcQ family protein [Planctomycetota bacterium]
MPAAALFGSAHKLLVGVVHLLPTPGAPRAAPIAALLARARADARALRAGGCHALIVENFGDAPFHKERVPAETIAALALALAEVRAVAGALPVGVNVLRNDARAALGLCAAAGAAFLRVNVHTGAMLTDQGIVEGRAADTLRERARLCPRAAILADVHVKHAAVLGAETLEDAAADAWERGGADALIVSGRGTGRAPQVERVARVRAAVPRARILVGSGLDAANAAALLEHADGAIVGSAFERGGKAGAPVDARRVAALARLFRR